MNYLRIFCFACVSCLFHLLPFVCCAVFVAHLSVNSSRYKTRNETNYCCCCCATVSIMNNLLLISYYVILISNRQIYYFSENSCFICDSATDH